MYNHEKNGMKCILRTQAFRTTVSGCSAQRYFEQQRESQVDSTLAAWTI
jgi:hypothetical protein